MKKEEKGIYAIMVYIPFKKNMFSHSIISKISSRIQDMKSTPLFLIFNFLGGFLTFIFFIINLKVYGNYTKSISYTIYFFSLICFVFANFFKQYNAETLQLATFLQFILRMSGLLILIISFFIGFPQSGGLLLFGCFLLFNNFKKSYLLFEASLSATISIMLSLLLIQFMPTYHETQLGAKIISYILKLFGHYSYCNENLLNMVINGKTYCFAVTYEQLGFWYFISAFMTLLIVLLINKFPKFMLLKILCITFLSSLLYFLMRYVILIFVYTLRPDIKIFYSPMISFISWLPWTIVYYLLLRKENITVNNHCSDFLSNLFKNKNLVPTITVSALYLIISCALFISLHRPTGTYKTGKIFIDEYHSPSWESVTQPLNTHEFLGQKSTYTYYSFVQYLRKMGDVEIISEGEDFNKITSSDILIIKTPTKDFSGNEISRIRDFVANGGGLFLIGDHTNLFGMSKRLNTITKPFNLQFRYDALYDLETTHLTNYDAQYNSYFPNYINSILGNYKFATSCSIKSSIFSHKIIVGNNLSSELLDMSHPNFFGDLSLSEEEMFGLFEQCSSVEYGKGRVIAFSDSTTFSSYSVFMHDNPIFIYSIINYLRQSNRFDYIKSFLILLILLVSIVIYQYRSKLNIKGVLIVYLISLPICLTVSSSLLTQIFSRHSDVINNEINKYETIYFLRSENEKELSHFVAMGDDKEQYSSLFLSFQRMGYFVRESKRLSDILKANTKLLIITDPLSLSSKDLPLIDKFIFDGGQVLFFYKEGAFNHYSSIFDFFQIRYKPTINTVDIQIRNGDNKDLSQIQFLNYIPVGNSKVNMNFASDMANIRLDTYEFEVAKGKLYILFSLENFDNMALGDPGVPATSSQRKQHELLFEMLKYVLETAK